MKKRLTEKQEKFCQLYVELGNASEAYRRAYDASKMKATTVNRKAKEILDNGKITARVEELKKEAKKRFEISVDDKKQWLVEIIKRTMQAEPVIGPDGEHTGEYKFDANNAIKAINELNKMDGDHAPTKNELTGKGGEPIQTDNVWRVEVVG